jgi:hypothetical protein
MNRYPAQFLLLVHAWTYKRRWEWALALSVTVCLRVLGATCTGTRRAGHLVRSTLFAHCRFVAMTQPFDLRCVLSMAAVSAPPDSEDGPGSGSGSGSDNPTPNSSCLSLTAGSFPPSFKFGPPLCYTPPPFPPQTLKTAQAVAAAAAVTTSTHIVSNSVLCNNLLHCTAVVPTCCRCFLFIRF